jgi:hypothetical protein
MQVADTKRDDFLHPGAGIEHGGKQRVIATSIGRGSIHAREYRLNLIVFEILNGAGTGALEGDGKHPLAMLDPRGVRGRTVSEKGVNGCQPDVSGRDEIMSTRLQLLKECQHLGGAEITQIQLVHGSLPPVGHKTEEEHEGVSITENRMRTAPSHAG